MLLLHMQIRRYFNKICDKSFLWWREDIICLIFCNKIVIISVRCTPESFRSDNICWLWFIIVRMFSYSCYLLYNVEVIIYFLYLARQLFIGNMIDVCNTCFLYIQKENVKKQSVKNTNPFEQYQNRTEI